MRCLPCLRTLAGCKAAKASLCKVNACSYLQATGFTGFPWHTLSEDTQRLVHCCRCTIWRLRSSQKALRACWQADIPHTVAACASTPGQTAQGLSRQEDSQLPYGTTEASPAGVGTSEVASRAQPLQSEGTPHCAAAPARSAGARTPADAAQGLPIQEVIGEVLAALDAGSALVLQAPPGAGKTTAVPLALLLHAPPWLQGKVVLVRKSRTRCWQSSEAVQLESCPCT